MPRKTLIANKNEKTLQKILLKIERKFQNYILYFGYNYTDPDLNKPKIHISDRINDTFLLIKQKTFPTE